MPRFLFALVQALKFKRAIQSSLRVATISDLDLAQLAKTGIKVLILDFDGVLNAHGQEQINPLLLNWLNAASKSFKLYILSNKPTDTRVAYFAQNFPHIHFVTKVAPKPYPAGILQIQKLSATIAAQILIIDDRLLTGILAGHLAGIKTCFIQAPWVDFKHNFFVEFWFLLLRLGERIYLGVDLNDVCGYRKLH